MYGLAAQKCMTMSAYVSVSFKIILSAVLVIFEIIR